MMIDIASAFSTYPSGRVPSDGKFNGETFRREILVPALRDLPQGELLNVSIDGVRSFGSSFLEEAFGGLIRIEGFRRAYLRDRMQVVCTKPHLEMYREAIQNYLDDAEKSIGRN